MCPLVVSTGLGAAAHLATAAEIVPSQVAKPTDRDCGLVLGERATVVLGFAGEVQGVARFHNLPQADASYDGVDIIGTKGALAVRGGFTKKLFRRRGHTFAEQDRWQAGEGFSPVKGLPGGLRSQLVEHAGRVIPLRSSPPGRSSHRAASAGA